MEEFNGKGIENAGVQSREVNFACLTDANSMKSFNVMNQGRQNESVQNMLPKLDIDGALAFQPASKGSKAFENWQKQATARSNESLDKDCHGQTTAQKGDSLWGIAERSMKEQGGNFSKKDVLNEMNRIIQANKDQYPWLETNPQFLKEGMKLTVPASPKAAEAAMPQSLSSPSTRETNVLGSSFVETRPASTAMRADSGANRSEFGKPSIGMNKQNVSPEFVVKTPEGAAVNLNPSVLKFLQGASSANQNFERNAATEMKTISSEIPQTIASRFTPKSGR